MDIGNTHALENCSPSSGKTDNNQWLMLIATSDGHQCKNPQLIGNYEQPYGHAPHRLQKWESKSWSDRS